LSRVSGIVFVEVPHQFNTQCSDEEAEAIEGILNELSGRCVVGRDGTTHPLTPEDVLIVAPYNMQVRKLQARLGPAARVGSVDRFQGQEAAVVIVSISASGAEDAPRGLEFILNKNRLNVAVSRATCLAIVVGCRGLMAARCTSLEQIEMANLYCWLAVCLINRSSAHRVLGDVESADDDVREVYRLSQTIRSPWLGSRSCSSARATRAGLSQWLSLQALPAKSRAHSSFSRRRCDGVETLVIEIKQSRGRQRSIANMNEVLSITLPIDLNRRSAEPDSARNRSVTHAFFGDLTSISKRLRSSRTISVPARVTGPTPNRR
jgi:hypothetical protein